MLVSALASGHPEYLSRCDKRSQPVLGVQAVIHRNRENKTKQTNKRIRALKSTIFLRTDYKVTLLFTYPYAGVHTRSPYLCYIILGTCANQGKAERSLFQLLCRA